MNTAITVGASVARLRSSAFVTSIVDAGEAKQRYGVAVSRDRPDRPVWLRTLSEITTGALPVGSVFVFSLTAMLNPTCWLL
jgi:hypothetical protein